MQKSNKGNDAGASRFGAVGNDRNATMKYQGADGINLAVQRMAYLERGKEQDMAQVSRKMAVMGLMDEDVGDGLQEVEKWKALEPE